MQNKVSKALINSFGSKVIETGFSLVAAIVLARVLGPSIIGIFAISMVFIGFSRVLSSLGTADAIIRTSDEDLNDDLMSSIFWLNFFAGLVISIFIFLIATLTEDLIFKLGSSAVIGKLCWVLIPSALINVPNALLEREIKFERIFYVKLVAYSSSTILSIYFAIAGWELDALILQQYLIVCISLFATLYFARWSPKLVFSVNKLKLVMRFSSYLTLSKVVNYFTKQGDIFLLGFFSSSALVGIYSRGYQLTTSSLQLINGSIIKVFYPIIAAKQNDKLQMWNITTYTVTSLSIVYCFLFWIIYFYSNFIVLTILGEDWILVASLLPIFCVITFILGVASVYSQILKAMGKGSLMFKVTLVCSSLTLFLFYFGVHFGIVGLAISYMLGSLILYLTVLIICGVLLDASIIRILVINLLCGFLFFLISSFSKILVDKFIIHLDLVTFITFITIYSIISIILILSFYKIFVRHKFLVRE